MVRRAVVTAQETAHEARAEVQVRQVATALYNATCAALLVWEGAKLATQTGDARRLLLASLVLAHRLQPRDPLAQENPAREQAIAEQLILEKPVPLETATSLLATD